MDIIHFTGFSMTKIILKVIGILVVVIAIAASVGFNAWTVWQATQQANVQTGINICVKGIIDQSKQGDIGLKDGDKTITLTVKK